VSGKYISLQALYLVRLGWG